MGDLVPLMTEDVCRAADHAINNQLTALGGLLSLLPPQPKADQSEIRNDLLASTDGIHRIVRFLAHARQPEVGPDRSLSCAEAAEEIAARLREHGPVVTIDAHQAAGQTVLPLSTIKLVVEEFLSPMLVEQSEFPAEISISLTPPETGKQLTISHSAAPDGMCDSFRKLLDQVTLRRLEIAGVQATIHRTDHVVLTLVLPENRSV